MTEGLHIWEFWVFFRKMWFLHDFLGQEVWGFFMDATSASPQFQENNTPKGTSVLTGAVPVQNRQIMIIVMMMIFCYCCCCCCCCCCWCCCCCCCCCCCWLWLRDCKHKPDEDEDLEDKKRCSKWTRRFRWWWWWWWLCCWWWWWWWWRRMISQEEKLIMPTMSMHFFLQTLATSKWPAGDDVCYSEVSSHRQAICRIVAIPFSS